MHQEPDTENTGQRSPSVTLLNETTQTLQLQDNVPDCGPPDQGARCATGRAPLSAAPAWAAVEGPFSGAAFRLQTQERSRALRSPLGDEREGANAGGNVLKS